MDVQRIADRVKVTTLSLGAFRAQKLHKSESRAENARHGVLDKARVSVRITDHVALIELGKLHAQAYSAHKGMTRPSIQDGVRLVPVLTELEHARVMNSLRVRHEQLARDFCFDYPTLAQAAPAELKGLYDASAWPSLARVERSFRFDVRYLPCPTEGEWSSWLEESARAAEDELREQVIASLQRVVDRCSSDGRLYASVFSDLQELATSLPALNITDAADLTLAMSQASVLTNLNVEHVRENDELRTQAADKAREILSVFGSNL